MSPYSYLWHLVTDLYDLIQITKFPLSTECKFHFEETFLRHFFYDYFFTSLTISSAHYLFHKGLKIFYMKNSF